MLEHMYRGDGEALWALLEDEGVLAHSDDARVFIVEMGGIMLQMVADMFQAIHRRFGSTCRRSRTSAMASRRRKGWGTAPAMS